MCQVYYPYFKIECSSSSKKYNHKLYLFVLSLFCDKILIPARHLLEIGNDTFDILLKNKGLFQEGIVFSRIPKSKKNLDQYYNDIISKNEYRGKEAASTRISKIIQDLYKTDTKFTDYNPIDQQTYYCQGITTFLDEYSHNHRNVKGFDDVKNICSSTATKEDFDSALFNIKQNNLITKKTYTRIKNASDLIYFVSGASVGHLTVCYDSYFDYQCIRKEMESTISDFNNIINKHYDPKQIISLLKRLGIIEKETDLENLSLEDILYLRKLTCFTKFVKKFDEFSSKSSFDEFFEKEKSAFKVICNMKSLIISFFLTVISSLVSFLIAKTLITTIIISVVTLFISYIISYFLHTKSKYEIPMIENILDVIIGKINPVSLFLAKLRWRIESKKLNPN